MITALRRLLLRAAAGSWRRVRGPAGWRLLWLRHATFMIGVAGVITDQQGRVLLLKHRFWAGCPWGPPSGYVERGETFQAALAREVWEETGQRITDVEVRSVRSGFQLRVEVMLSARLVEGHPLRLEVAEIEEARFFTVDQLPDDLRPAHRALILAAVTEQGEG